MTAGVDRHTGRVLSGWEHVQQSLAVIFATRIGDRIMRRTFGSAVPGLLGKNMTPATVLRFWTAIAIAIALWEPRFRVRRFALPAKRNSAALASEGKLGLVLHGDYIPGALEGDFSIAVPKTVNL